MRMASPLAMLRDLIIVASSSFPRHDLIINGRPVAALHAPCDIREMSGLANVYVGLAPLEQIEASSLRGYYYAIFLMLNFCFCDGAQTATAHRFLQAR